MKHMNLIRLLAVLLCAMLLMAACSSGEELPPEENQQTGEPTPDAENNEGTEQPSAPVEVEPVLKNFFTFTSVKPWKTLKTAERLEGEYIFSNDHLMVLRDSKVDAMNQATETFTVFNMETGEAVLTKTNTYTYRADYAYFDWDYMRWHEDGACIHDPDAIYPESLMDVSIRNIWANGSGAYALVIEVRRAAFTPINEDSDEYDVDYYDVQTTYEYYDAFGVKLAESTRAAEPYVLYDDNGDITAMIGASTVTFDIQTGAAISVTASDGVVRKYKYDGENETYGYYLNQYQEVAHGSWRCFFEVYDKASGTRVIRHYIEECYDASAYLLQNGNVLVQAWNLAEQGMDYDYEDKDGCRWTQNTYIVEVPTGKVTEVSLNYVLNSVKSRQEAMEEMELEALGIYLTENVANFAIAYKINEQKIQEEGVTILVLGNDGSILFEFSKIIPEHYIDDSSQYISFGFSILSNGDYLVELDDNLSHADYAIVTQDGRVRAYLTDEAKIAGEYVVLPDGIYDYDLKKLYDFAENDVEFEYVVGERILVSMIPDEDSDPVIGTYYYELYKEEGLFLTKSAFGGENVTIDQVKKDYVIVCDGDTGKYVLYNVDLEHVLTTMDTMSVYSCGDRYVVGTYIDVPGYDGTVVYTLGE